MKRLFFFYPNLGGSVSKDSSMVEGELEVNKKASFLIELFEEKLTQPQLRKTTTFKSGAEGDE